MRFALYSQIRPVLNADGEHVNVFAKREEFDGLNYRGMRKATPTHVAVSHVSTRRATKADMERYLAAARR